MKKTDAIIIGAGPVGLFAIHQLGLKGLKAIVIDNLDKAGGQCIELYPDKPIYDIPAVPECTGEELTKNLLEQIKPFNTEFIFNERVEEVRQDKDKWIVKTNNNNEFSTPNIIIAGGVGSFEPRKLSLKEIEKFEGKSLFYAVKNKEELKNKKIDDAWEEVLSEKQMSCFSNWFGRLYECPVDKLKKRNRWGDDWVYDLTD